MQTIYPPWPNPDGLTTRQEPKPTYDGMVVGVEARDERIMSDVWSWCRYAVVVIDGKLERVSLGTGEFGYSDSEVTIDADVATYAVAIEAVRQTEYNRLLREHHAGVDRIVDEAMRPRYGKDVIVARGRKVPKGTVGRIFWTGNNGWGDSVGLDIMVGARHDRVFTAMKNVDVINPDDYMDVDAAMHIPHASLDAAAVRHAGTVVANWTQAATRRAA